MSGSGTFKGGRSSPLNTRFSGIYYGTAPHLQGGDMTGKNTAKNGLHPSGGGWVSGRAIQIGQKCATTLSGALGRELTTQEVMEIEHGLAIQWTLKASHDDKVSRQSVKTTLKYIADCAEDDVHEAYQNCDTTTGAEIGCALSAAGIYESSAASPAAIQSAAKAALLSVMSLESKGGAPAKGYQQMLAEWWIRSWKYYGQTNCAVWFKDESGDHSPLLTWTLTLFSTIEKRPFDRRKAERLLVAAIKAGKVSTV